MEVNKQGAEDIPDRREGSDGLDQGGQDTIELEVIEVMIVAATEECSTAVTVNNNDESMEQSEQDLTAEEANQQPERLPVEEDQDMQEPVHESEDIPEQPPEETYPGSEEQQTVSHDVEQDTAVSKEDVCPDPNSVELNQEESVNRVTDSGEGEGTENSDGLYKCRFCETKFKDKSDWTEHEQEHSSNNPHVHNLREHHELTQSIQIVWECQTCAEVSVTQEELIEHLKSHNQEISTEPQCSDQDTSGKGANLEMRGKKYFRCRFCFKCFGSKEEKWRRHELLHSSETSLKCYICEEVFCRKHQFEAHMKRHATNNKNKELECKFCNSYFPSEGCFEEHIKAHVEELLTEQKNRKAKKRPKSKRKSKKRVEKKDFKCRFCQKSFKERQDRCHKHELTHFTVYKCYICEEMFSSRVRCNLHEMQHETKCRHCEEMFSSVHDLRIHEATHAKTKLHQCRYCDKLFYKTSNRRRHELTHTGEKPHKCSFCDKAFRLLHHKKKHERIQHKETTEVTADSDLELQNYGIPTVLPPPSEKDTTEEPPMQEVVEPKYFRCRFCLKCFGSKEEKCRRHELLHLSDTSLKCKFCDEVFCRKHQFDAHVQKHINASETLNDNSVLECQLCNTFFVTEEALQEHLNSHANELRTQQKNRKEGKESQDKTQKTSKKKEFSCRFCQKPFEKRQDRCEKHELKHFWKPAYKCFFCEKLFNTKVKRNVHEMEHEAKCHYCDEIFTSVSKLKIHEATHKKTRLYRCGYCEKMFHKTSNRRRHEMTHTGEKPYKCSQCEKAFRLVHHLKKHERLHEQNTPA